MKRTIFLAMLLALAAIAPVEALNSSDSRCEEDMPCWNCETMGNKICGPSVTYSEMLTETIPGLLPESM